MLDDVAPGAHGYPRPQLRRDEWHSLNGPWEFAIDPEGHVRRDAVTYDRTIVVPFAPETPASGIGDTGFYRACWYRRRFEPPGLASGERLVLHFGAVDYRAEVWLNGRSVAVHEGGYTPFCADITGVLVDGEQELVVRAEDDPHDLQQPRGKQDWQLEPHGIWYPRTTGIWQTVWLERVPGTFVERLVLGSDLARFEVNLEAWLNATPEQGMTLQARLTIGDQVLAEDVYAVVERQVHRRIALSDPGIDSFRNEFLWRPSRPTLIDVELELRDAGGRAIDRVRSYTALRAVGVQGDRFVLNRRPYQLRLVLDQGYWPESGLTPPDDAALRRDVELVKQMGFNGVRKHQKIEDPRFLYWADVLGLVVWEEMPSAYRFTNASIHRLTREWIEAIERDRNHPCIVTWVPFNESWGVPDLPEVAEQRHWVQALYHLTRTLDPSRPVVGNDGWEFVATDLVGVHDYDDDPDRIRVRYTDGDAIGSVLERERPGGRLLSLLGEEHAGKPLLLTEFGGILYAPDAAGLWAYSRTESPAELSARYARLLAAVHDTTALAGFCYTQLTDTYQERNGLLYSDRTPKFPVEEMALANFGSVPEYMNWREAPPWGRGRRPPLRPPAR